MDVLPAAHAMVLPQPDQRTLILSLLDDILRAIRIFLFIPASSAESLRVSRCAASLDGDFSAQRHHSGLWVPEKRQQSIIRGAMYSASIRLISIIVAVFQLVLVTRPALTQAATTPQHSFD